MSHGRSLSLILIGGFLAFTFQLMTMGHCYALERNGDPSECSKIAKETVVVGNPPRATCTYQCVRCTVDAEPGTVTYRCDSWELSDSTGDSNLCHGFGTSEAGSTLPPIQGEASKKIEEDEEMTIKATAPVKVIPPAPPRRPPPQMLFPR